MQSPSPIRAYPSHTVLRTLTVLVFLSPVVAYLACAIQRMDSPVLLEWMEAGSLQMMQQVLSGKPLYAAPSVEFVPYTYTPLYFYLSALLSGVVGSGLFPLRLLSFVASLVSFLLLFTIVRRETASSRGGMAAVGLFAGSYAVNGNWFDIARIDSLCIALLLAGVTLGLGEARSRNLIAGGLLVAFAFFTKQVALVIAAPLMLAVGIRHGKIGGLFALSALGTIVVGSLAWNVLSAGWFLFYVLESPGARWRGNLSLGSLTQATLYEFLPLFIVSIAVALPTIASQLRRPRRREMSFLLVVSGLFLAAAWGRVESINFLNSSIPAHLGVAFLLGIGVGKLLNDSNHFRTNLAILGAFILQLSIFTMMLGPLRPTEQENANYSRYSSFIHSLPKPMYIPDQGFVPTLGSDNSFAHSIGIMDLMMGGSPAVVEEFRRKMTEALNARRFKTIVCDTPLFERWFKEELHRNYELSPLEATNTTWTPVLGFQNRPRIFTPRKDVQ